MQHVVSVRSAWTAGVSPLCGAGLLRCASSRWHRPSVSPLSVCHPSRGLAAKLHAAGVQLAAGLQPAGFAGALADAAIKAAPSSQGRTAGMRGSGRRCRQG